MTSVVALHPIVAALMRKENAMGERPVWRAINVSQYYFIRYYPVGRADLAQCADFRIEALMHTGAAGLNLFLKEKKMRLHAEDFDPDQFALTSVFYAMAEWQAHAHMINMPIEGMIYPGVYMMPMCMVNGTPVRVFTAMASLVHNHAIARLITRQGVRVYLTAADKPYAGFDLLNRINAIHSHLSETGSAICLVFPMVYMEVIEKVEWLSGLFAIGSDGRKSSLACAIQKVIFMMNHLGVGGPHPAEKAPAQSNAVPICIDSPFFLWAKRPGMSIPYLYAYVDKDSWHDPGDITFR